MLGYDADKRIDFHFQGGLQGVQEQELSHLYHTRTHFYQIFHVQQDSAKESF